MSSTPKDDDDLIPLKEFARRLGRNVEAARRRFDDIAVERRGRLYFKPSDLARLRTCAFPSSRAPRRYRFASNGIMVRQRSQREFCNTFGC